MSAIISNDVQMKEILKVTGFDCPQEMENKTFERATSVFYTFKLHSTYATDYVIISSNNAIKSVTFYHKVQGKTVTIENNSKPNIFRSTEVSHAAYDITIAFVDGTEKHTDVTQFISVASSDS